MFLKFSWLSLTTLGYIYCDKGNIGYEYECTRCPDKAVYVGETSRTAFTRLTEHLEDYRSAAAALLPAQVPVLPPGGIGYPEKKRVNHVFGSIPVTTRWRWPGPSTSAYPGKWTRTSVYKNTRQPIRKCWTRNMNITHRRAYSQYSTNSRCTPSVAKLSQLDTKKNCLLICNI